MSPLIANLAPEIKGNEKTPSAVNPANPPANAKIV